MYGNLFVRQISIFLPRLLLEEFIAVALCQGIYHTNEKIFPVDELCYTEHRRRKVNSMEERSILEYLRSG